MFIIEEFKVLFVVSRFKEVFGEYDEKRCVQENFVSLCQICLVVDYVVVFKIDSLCSKINDVGLMQFFYNGFKEEVKGELCMKLRFDIIDKYIVMVICIDDRQFQCCMEKRGNMWGYYGNNCFNDKCKW